MPSLLALTASVNSVKFGDFLCASIESRDYRSQHASRLLVGAAAAEKAYESDSCSGRDSNITEPVKYPNVVSVGRGHHVVHLRVHAQVQATNQHHHT